MSRVVLVMCTVDLVRDVTGNPLAVGVFFLNDHVIPSKVAMLHNALTRRAWERVGQLSLLAAAGSNVVHERESSGNTVGVFIW